MEQSDFGDDISADFEHREHLKLVHKNLIDTIIDCMLYIKICSQSPLQTIPKNREALKKFSKKY